MKRLALWLSLTPALPAAAVEGGSSVFVEVSGVRERGEVACYLYARADDFPTHPERAVQLVWCAREAGRARCRFEGVAAGTYAAACFQDENGNRKLDFGWLIPMPMEPTAASNGAKGRFGPPKFEDARFEVPRASPVVVPLPRK